MDTLRAFRWLTEASIGLLVLLAVSVYFDPQLPVPVKDWYENEANGSLFRWMNESIGDQHTLLIAILLAVLLLCIGVLCGLLMLKRWARGMYLAITLIDFAITPFSGYTVSSPWTTLALQLWYAVNGALVVLLLFVPAIREQFVPRPS
jgi:hypothetical protein